MFVFSVKFIGAHRVVGGVFADCRSPVRMLADEMVYTDKESVSCRQSGSLLGQLRPGYGFSTTQTVCTKSFHRVISPMPRRSQDMRHIEYRSGILQFPPPSQLPKGGFYTLWLYKKKVWS